MKPDILMLGWEFPPLINGGLGVACKGIADAISDIANLKLIIPKAFTSSEKYEVIGINSSISTKKKYPVLFANYSTNQSGETISPYHNESKENLPDHIFKTNNQNNLYNYNINTLYGGDMMNKVEEYKNAVLKISDTLNFEIIHAHDWMTMEAGIALKKIKNKPLVMHVHSLETDRSGKESRGYIYELEKKSMMKADLIIAVSHYTKKQICEHYQIDSNKIEVVHNGIEQKRKATSKKNDAKITRVAFVGRLTMQKGANYFINIAEKVLQTNKNFRFVLAGNGEQMSELIQSTAKKSIGNKVHFTGFLDEEKMEKLLTSSDIYCMPSISEPFGLSALEAASYQLPCILSKQSGVIETLKNSIQFDYWDVDKAAGAIINLSKNKSLSKEINKNAKRELNKTNWSDSAHKIINHYYSHNLIPK